MIDPKLLTEESGFVEGVVVEVVQHGHGYLSEKMTTCAWWRREGYAVTMGYRSFPNEMISIRPLTGPMAIWNFLPRNIKAVIFDEDGWPKHQFFDTMPDDMMPKAAVSRPWWAVQ